MNYVNSWEIQQQNNKVLSTMKCSQKHMPLLDEILQPKSIISLEWKIPQKLLNSLSIFFLGSTKLEKSLEKNNTF